MPLVEAATARCWGPWFAEAPASAPTAADEGDALADETAAGGSHTTQLQPCLENQSLLCLA